MPRHPAVLLVLVLVVMSASARTSSGGVKITRKPPKVVHTEFDPANKPADMPKLTGGEIAVCEGQYGIAGRVVYAPSVRRQANGLYLARVVVNDVLIDLDLTNGIWLPRGASAKLKAHEEGHRQIAEMVYDRIADKAARQAAEKLDGRRFEGTGATSKEASEAAEAEMNKAHSAMIQSYLDQTSRAGQRTQERYDQITAHGTRAEIVEADAITQAFAEVPPPLWPRPATNPATHPAAKPISRPAITGSPATKPTPSKPASATRPVNVDRR